MWLHHALKATCAEARARHAQPQRAIRCFDCLCFVYAVRSFVLPFSRLSRLNSGFSPFDRREKNSMAGCDVRTAFRIGSVAAATGILARDRCQRSLCIMRNPRTHPQYIFKHVRE